jgi:hypothetical protein
MCETRAHYLMWEGRVFSNISNINRQLSVQECTECVRPASGLPRIGRESPRRVGRGLFVVASFSLPASRNCWGPRNSGTRRVLLRMHWFTRLPPAAPASRAQASMRSNQAFPARSMAPVLAMATATAMPHAARMAIAPSAPAPAARRCMPQSAYFPTGRRRRPTHLHFPRLPRRPFVSAQPCGLRLLPGSPARLPSRSD